MSAGADRGRRFEDRLAGELAAYGQQLAGDRDRPPLERAIALCTGLRLTLAELRLKLEQEPADVLPGRRLIAAALKAAYEGGMPDGPVREELRDALEGLSGV